MQSITSNKIRSFLTMLGIIIGVAAVMIMVSVVQGGNKEMKEYYEAQGNNKINIYAYKYNGLDVTEDLYQYCLSLSEFVVGVTPSTTTWGTVKYLTTNCDNNQDLGTPQIYLGSDQFSVCNNYKLARRGDISYLDCKKASKVVVIAASCRSICSRRRIPSERKSALAAKTLKSSAPMPPWGRAASMPGLMTI